jgi:hypothetical protein
MRGDTTNLVEIVLGKPKDFTRIREILTRIGVPSRDEKRLFQSCHILHKQGKYYLVHFKELFLLDGKTAEFDYTDVARRNSVVNYLLSLGFFTLASGLKFLEPHLSPPEDFKIITYRQKVSGAWTCVPKYTIGSAKTFGVPILDKMAG